MNILLVDDSAVSRALLQPILGAQNHEVAAVANGLEAWSVWQQHRHRIVISDWMMPGMDGLELCRRIRAHSPESRTYFILQTVRSDALAEALEAGVDDFISKPIEPAELLARVEKATRALGL